MSTIDPTVLDPTDKPPDGSGDANNPVNYLAATERGWKGDAQTQFANAKTDVETLEGDVSALQTGKLSSAAGAVGTTNLADNAVTNDKSALMSFNTIKARVATSGNPQDVDLETLADGGSPDSSLVVLGKKKSGDLIKVDGSTFQIPNPPSAKGEIWSHDGTQNQRLAPAADGLVLKLNSATATGLNWEAEAGGGGGVTDPPSAKGDLWSHNGAITARLPVGTDGFVLKANAAATLGVEWAAETGGGGGSGISQGSPSNNGELMAMQDVTGDGTAQTVGFGASVVARTDSTNAFADDCDFASALTKNSEEVVAEGDVLSKGVASTTTTVNSDTLPGNTWAPNPISETQFYSIIGTTNFTVTTTNFPNTTAIAEVPEAIATVSFTGWTQLNARPTGRGALLYLTRCGSTYQYNWG